MIWLLKKPCGSTCIFGVGRHFLRVFCLDQVVAPWETIFSTEFPSTHSLPSLASLESWKLIVGFGFAIFATQVTETATALNVVDRLDESEGPGFCVLVGQGLANVASGLFGGMGGSGVVSMSVLADRTFGTTCLSTFMTGLIVLVFVAWGYPVVDFIPLSSISGISIAIAISSIQWRSMAAILTTCLPDAKRDWLPPQYNIARVDVLVMFLVTTACLVVDFATLLVFVLGLAVFVYSAVRTCCASRKAKGTKKTVSENEDQEEGIDCEQRDVPAIPPNEQEVADPVTGQDQPPERQCDIGCPSYCGMMESVTELNTREQTDSNGRRQKISQLKFPCGFCGVALGEQSCEHTRTDWQRNEQRQQLS